MQQRKAARAGWRIYSAPVIHGGGGDSGGSGPQYVDVSAANRDAVSHAAAAGIVVLSSGSETSSTVTPAAASRRSAQSALHSLVSKASTQTVGTLRKAQSASSSDGRRFTQALYGPDVEPCLVSGSTSTTIDDRDNDGYYSVGDVITTVFNNCKDISTDTLNGTVSMTITQSSATPVLSIGMLVTMAQLSDVAPTRSLTLNGAVQLAYTEPSASVQNTTMTVKGSVVASVSNALFDDTVTLRDGYVEAESHDSVLGRTVASVNGSFQSARAGGLLDISTPTTAPVTTYDGDLYPTAGVVQVQGAKGSLWLTALPTNSVQLDLDANDDGSIEASVVVAWDWLL